MKKRLARSLLVLVHRAETSIRQNITALRDRHRPPARGCGSAGRRRRGTGCAPRRARRRCELLVDQRRWLRRAPIAAAHRELALSSARSSRASRRRSRCAAPSAPRIERTHAQVGRRAVVREAGAHGSCISARRRAAVRDQVRQREVVEEDLHELFACVRRKTKSSSPSPIARLRRSPPPPPPPCGRSMRSPRTYSWLPGCTISRVAAAAVAERPAR